MVLKNRVSTSLVTIFLLSICASVEAQWSSWIPGMDSALKAISPFQEAPMWRDKENYQVVLEEVGKGYLKRVPGELPVAPGTASASASEVESNLQKALCLLNPACATKMNVTDDKTRFSTFIQHIRNAATSPAFWNPTPESKASVAQLHELVKALFNDVRITQYANNLVEKMARAGGNHSLLPLLKEESSNIKERTQNRLETLAASLEAVEHFFAGVKNAPSELKNTTLERSMKSFRGGVTAYEFDPILDGSLYSMKYEALRGDDQESLKCLRLPTTTIGSDCNARVNPEFAAYLNALKQEGKTHVYVNFQNGQQPTGLKLIGIENEMYRAQCLQRLPENPEFKDVLTVITLPKNSEFYWQKGAVYGAPRMNAQEFLQKMEYEIFENANSGFYFPQAYKEMGSEKRNQISDLLAKVMVTFYPEQTELSVKDRQNFIEYAYAFIAQNVAAKAHSCNKTCKDGIDRAGGANGFDHFILTTLEAASANTSTEKFNDHLGSLAGMILADALMAQNREIKQERFERYLQVARDLVGKIKSHPGTLSNMAEISPFTGTHIILNQNQKVNDPKLN